MEKSGPKTTKEHISLIFDSIIDIIKYPKTPLDNNAYFYHTLYRNEFIIYIYIFKLFINDNDYLKQKYLIYKNKYHEKIWIESERLSDYSISYKSTDITDECMILLDRYRIITIQ